jgi:membrane protease YdiL (CAAX protease family)
MQNLRSAIIKLIRNLSPKVELVIVLILGFGLFIYSSTLSFFIVNSNYSKTWTYKLTNEAYFSIVIYETLALFVILYILKARDWKLADFNLDFTIRMIWVGFLLIIVRNVISNILIKAFEFSNILDQTTTKHVQYGLESNWISISLIIIINSFYEEFLFIGYFFKRLEKWHPAIVIGLSMIIRLSCHTYQGWMSLFSIVPTGIIFGYYYIKYKKLWPLIFAHGFWNLMAFMSMHFHWVDKIQHLKSQIN